MTRRGRGKDKGGRTHVCRKGAPRGGQDKRGSGQKGERPTEFFFKTNNETPRGAGEKGEKEERHLKRRTKKTREPTETTARVRGFGLLWACFLLFVWGCHPLSPPPPSNRFACSRPARRTRRRAHRAPLSRLPNGQKGKRAARVRAGLPSFRNSPVGRYRSIEKETTH